MLVFNLVFIYRVVFYLSIFGIILWGLKAQALGPFPKLEAQKKRTQISRPSQAQPTSPTASKAKPSRPARHLHGPAAFFSREAQRPSLSLHTCMVARLERIKLMELTP